MKLYTYALVRVAGPEMRGINMHDPGNDEGTVLEHHRHVSDLRSVVLTRD